jgi:hypothetical protein
MSRKTISGNETLLTVWGRWKICFIPICLDTNMSRVLCCFLLRKEESSVCFWRTTGQWIHMTLFQEPGLYSTWVRVLLAVLGMCLEDIHVLGTVRGFKGVQPMQPGQRGLDAHIHRPGLWALMKVFSHVLSDSVNTDTVSSCWNFKRLLEVE